MIKLEKINSSIEKTKTRIVELQNRLQALENKKIEARNSEILNMINNSNISTVELSELIFLFQSDAKNVIEHTLEEVESEK